jgi:hypothetical protein
MAKKAILFAAVIWVCGTALFAQEEVKSRKPLFGIGVGGFIGGDSGGGGAEGKVSAGGHSLSIKYETPYSGGGGFAFFDTTYLELTLGIYSGEGKMTLTVKESPGDDISATVDMSIVNFNIGLLGKCPLILNQKLSIFPLFGFEYDIRLSAKDEDGNEYKDADGNDSPGDFSALWIKLGGGLDFSFTEKIYLRSEVLYGVRLSNKFETDLKNTFDEAFTELKNAGAYVDTKILDGHGLTAKLALGYKF